ncbi:MAG: DUF368 domain-containing protein [Clostridiales bacterium]|nr:DUF368 domain-containing protein [Clostridiales bacterium]
MEIIINILKGVVISISQIVPGVSGGTIAIVLGIYDKLIHAVNNIIKDFKNQYKILLQVGIGAILGMFIFSNIINVIIDKYPIQIGYMFIGIILGGAPLMFKKSTENGFKKKNLIYLAIGIIVALLLSGSGVDNSAVIRELSFMNAIWLFIAGVIIAVALILPGISGSFMLLILGLYNTVMAAISEINIIVLLPILVGGIVGTLATARLIEWLLKKFPGETYMMIFGFVLASVTGVFPGFQLMQSLIGLILGIIGFMFTYKITKFD